MHGLRLLVLCGFLYETVTAYRKPLPLTDFIEYYETLNYDPEGLSQRHDRIRRSLTGKEHLRFSFSAHGRDFKIRLRRDTDIFTDDFIAENVEFDPSKVVAGEVEGDEHSLVHGFISDGVFEGKIHTSNDEYHVENGKKYFNDPTDFHSVIYRSSDVKYPHSYGSGCGISDKTKRWMKDVRSSAQRDSPSREVEHDMREEPVLNRYRRAAVAEDPNKKVCTLLMQADHLFTEHVAGGNKERALLKMTEHVKAITTIFKNQLREAHFIIKRMRANDSDDAKETPNPFATNLGVEKLLELNSLENHNDVCLAYIFTYRDFADGVLGLAWVGEPGSAAGGICEKYITFRDGGKKSLNTGVVTFLNYGADIPQKVSEITFAHEAGHNFGSPHDNSQNCAPGGSSGNFIMFAKATSGDKSNNRRFSSCSVDKMTAVMNVKGWCEDEKCCFIKPGQPICGNGVVEAGEECDCGYKSDKTCEEDKCCNGREEGDGSTGCKLTKGANCSPSAGPCCNPASCSIVNTTTLCLNESNCANETFCNGINATCPMPPPKANLTECNEGRQVCLSGSCAGSICLKHGLQECQCEEESLQCHVCCTYKDKCSATKDIETIKKELQHHPGAPCDDFNGYCDVFLKCRKVDADGPLARLKNKFFSKEAIMGYIEWIETHWWAVVLMGVGLILLMAGFIKCCSVHTPSSNPNRKPARQLTLRRQQQRQQQLRNQRNQRARQQQQPPRYDDDPPPYYPGAIEMAPGQQ